MSYISKYLCHFVGRAQATDDERFQLLIKIIKENQLKANLKDPDHPEMILNNDYKGDRYGELLSKCDCVCFCDIPDNMLEVHTEKYGHFGMGFDKGFLCKQGARPVQYVPLGAQMKDISRDDTPKKSPMEYYIYLEKLGFNFNTILCMLNSFFPISEQLKSLIANHKEYASAIQTFDHTIIQNIINGKSYSMLFSEIMGWSTQCAYIKIFDETLSETDPDNYYMEREWRVIRSVDFTLDDIQQIYLPNKKYQEEFLTEFPTYKGKFWIFDEGGR